MSAPYPPSRRQDRPYLLPSNRKLRHLTSISLRNLSLSAPSRRSISHQKPTTDDDLALPQTLRSPAKLVALREQKAQSLSHARSSNDLRSVSEEHDAAVIDGEVVTNGRPASQGDGRPKTPRPSVKRMRRRSTLTWASSTPQRRQERLESVTAERLADVFFSAHVVGVEEPIYVSEVVEKTMNPTFRRMDLQSCGSGILREGRVTLRFWVRSRRNEIEEWRQLLEIHVQLSALQYLGKSLDNLRHPLPLNAVVFHLPDGIYTPLALLNKAAPLLPMPTLSPTSTAALLPTSTFDALLRLAKLTDSIQDALETRNAFASDLERLLDQHRTALTDRDHVAELHDRGLTIAYAQKTVRNQLAKGRRQLDEKRGLLSKRRQAMVLDLEQRMRAKEMMLTGRDDIPAIRQDLDVAQEVARSQHARLCMDLQRVYPLTSHPATKSALATWKIRSIALPMPAALDSQPPETSAAALGHVAHALQMLSFYTAAPLLYPVNLRGSTSTIRDPISLLKTSSTTKSAAEDDDDPVKGLRTYPLFSKGVPWFRFEYGVFLLEKDIEILLEARGVRVRDTGGVLGKLKVLLDNIVSAGGEGVPVPETEERGEILSDSGIAGLSPNGDARSSKTTGRARENGKGAAESLRRSVR